MTDFNYPESQGGIKDSPGLTISSFLEKGSYKGNMQIPSDGESSVGDVSSSEASLDTYANKTNSI